MDTRFTPCRAIYEADFPVAAPTSRGVCRWVGLKDNGPLADPDVQLFQTKSGRIIREISNRGGELAAYSFADGSGVYSYRGGFPGARLLSCGAGSRTVTWTDTGTTYTVQFDLSQGGIITSFDRDGVEYLEGGIKGIEAQLIWTDVNQTGEFVRHNLVQGVDQWGGDATNRRGAIVRAFSHTPQSDGSQVVGLEFYPIVQITDGTQSVPMVSTWHEGGGPLFPVYAFGMPMTVTHHFGVGGNKDLHKTYLTVTNQEELIESAFFDMSLYLAFWANPTTFPQFEAYDNVSATQITSGGTGWVEDDRRYTMDDTVLQGDDETSSSASLIGENGWMSARGATEDDEALSVGGFMDSDNKSSDRVLGDAPDGNGWSWKNSATTRMVAYGQWLTNRIHSSTVRRTLPFQTSVTGNVFWATGTLAENRSQIDTPGFVLL